MTTISQRYAYGLSSLRSDLQAALTVAAISLPQSIAYALIAGVDPRFGLYTAIVFTAIAAILGSSSQLVNGPTGAVSLVVFSALSFIDPDARLDAYEAMFLLTAMIGIVQITIAVLKLGDLTRYISESVVTGFMVGAATLTIIGQVGNALGLKNIGTGHQHVLYRLWMTLTQPGHVNRKAFAVSFGAILLAIGARKLVRRYRLPQLDMFAVLLLVSVPAYYAGWSHAALNAKPAIALIEAVPSSLPRAHIPDIRFGWILQMSSSAAAIGFLGLLEALAIAKAISYKTRQKLDYNRQCLAEGLGNLVSAFFRCMPGSGSLSRSAINFQAGAVSKLSGVFCALFVAVMVLLLGPFTRYIPKAALAGLLVVAAARLIDVERLRYIARASRYDAALLVATTLAALLVGVEFAILIGVAVSLLLFVPRASKLRISELVVSDERIVRERLPHDEECTAISIYDLEGELFFGAAPTFEACLEQAKDRAKSRGNQHLVIRFKRLRNPDAVCLEKLEVFLRDSQKDGLVVLLAGIRPDLSNAFARLRFAEWFPQDRVFLEEDEADSATLKAVRDAFARLGERNPCPHCEARPEPGGELRAAYYLV
ncbi:MAG: SulP family inorganic anion transporter [Polyangiaceae bacterium]